MLFDRKTSVGQFATPPEAILAGITVLDTWALAAVVTPLVIGATVRAVQALEKQQDESRSELEMALKDFCAGR